MIKEEKEKFSSWDAIFKVSTSQNSFFFILCSELWRNSHHSTRVCWYTRKLSFPNANLTSFQFSRKEIRGRKKLYIFRPSLTSNISCFFFFSFFHLLFFIYVLESSRLKWSSLASFSPISRRYLFQLSFFFHSRSPFLCWPCSWNRSHETGKKVEIRHLPFWTYSLYFCLLLSATKTGL